MPLEGWTTHFHTVFYMRNTQAVISQKVSVFAVVIRFFTQTLIHNKKSLLTVRHDDYLLLSEVDHNKGPHPHHLHIKQTEDEDRRGWSCCLGGRGASGRRSSRDKHTWYNFTEIHNFCLTFLLFHFSKKDFYMVPSLFPCLLQFHCPIIKGSML